MTSYVLVILVVLIVAFGQLLFKFVALRFPHGTELTGFFSDQTAMLALGSALTLYAGATGLWLYALRSLPLSAAYPFLALSFVIVPVAAAVFLEERLSLYDLFGGMLIVAGIYLSTRAD